LRAYGAHILSLEERKWPLKEGKSNELEPRVLPLSTGARDVWIGFSDHAESQSGPNRELAPVTDLAAKAAEHAGVSQGDRVQHSLFVRRPRRAVSNDEGPVLMEIGASGCE
jgi:hypothetical protein